MKRLRKMTSQTALGSQPESQGGKTQEETGKKKKKKQTQTTKTKAEKKGAEDKKKKKKKKLPTVSKGKEGEQEQKKTKRRSLPEKPEPKAKAVAKRKKKVEEIPVDDATKQLVLNILKECNESKCTHPSFDMPTPSKTVELSTYWNRNAVGVKVARSLLKNKKAQGAGKAQVAYFGCKSSCCYTNIALAGLWVFRLQFSSLTQAELLAI